jgi:hypothetical protein
MRFKLLFLTLCAFLLSAGLAFYVFVDGLSQRRPDVIELSATRQYILERVPLRVFFFGEDLAYLRVTDQDEPKIIYRSPLSPIGQLDMNLVAGPGKIGVSTVDFNTDKKYFVFHVKQWKEHWLNRFVSNTPYSVEPPVESSK